MEEELGTIQNLTGQSFGTLTVGDIVSIGQPRRYAVSCICGSSWIETHEHLMRFINGNALIPCRNEEHRRGLTGLQDRSKQQYHRELAHEIEYNRNSAEHAEYQRLSAIYGNGGAA